MEVEGEVLAQAVVELVHDAGAGQVSLRCKGAAVLAVLVGQVQVDVQGGAGRGKGCRDWLPQILGGG